MQLLQFAGEIEFEIVFFLSLAEMDLLVLAKVNMKLVASLRFECNDKFKKIKKKINFYFCSIFFYSFNVHLYRNSVYVLSYTDISRV